MYTELSRPYYNYIYYKRLLVIYEWYIQPCMEKSI